MANETLVELRIVVIGAPLHRGGEFGVQAKDGSVHAGKRQPDGSVVFHVDVRAARSASDAKPRFLGPLTHGPATNRHLYLIRASEEAPSTWTGRMKVPLASISWHLIESAGARGLEATVAGGRGGTVPVDWSPRTR